MHLINNTIYRFLIIACTFAFTIQCEKDDICVKTVKETPNLVILMLEKESGNRKVPSSFLIRPIGNDSILKNVMSDSLALPLRLNEKSTQFEFILNAGNDNQNIDTLQFNYQRWDRYISSACGYTAHYIFKDNPITLLNPGQDWIKGVVILNDTIFDETKAHLGILY